MNKQLEQVKGWHEKFNVPIGKWSEIPDNRRIMLRMKLLEEEAWEVRMALQKSKFDRTTPKSVLMGQVMKEVCDVIYVLYGTLLEYGLHTSFEDGFNEVHASNMTKCKQNEDIDGKVLKGPNFVPANMEKLFI
jgi:predicted HAD superfamily Cof-like phosphohydrolase